MPRTDYVPRQTTTLLRVLGIVSLFFPDVLMALHPRAHANVILSSRLPVVSPKNKQSEHAHVLTLTHTHAHTHQLKLNPLFVQPLGVKARAFRPEALPDFITGDLSTTHLSPKLDFPGGYCWVHTCEAVDTRLGLVIRART